MCVRTQQGGYQVPKQVSRSQDQGGKTPLECFVFACHPTPWKNSKTLLVWETPRRRIGVHAQLHVCVCGSQLHGCMQTCCKTTRSFSLNWGWAGTADEPKSSNAARSVFPSCYITEDAFAAVTSVFPSFALLTLSLAKKNCAQRLIDPSFYPFWSSIWTFEVAQTAPMWRNELLPCEWLIRQLINFM